MRLLYLFLVVYVVTLIFVEVMKYLMKGNA